MASVEILLKTDASAEEPVSYFINDVLEIEQFSIENLKDGKMIIRLYTAPGNEQGIKDRLSQWMEGLKGNDIETGGFEIESKLLHDEDWMNNWKKFFKPIDVDGKLCVRPPWEEKIPGRIDLVINPKMGFGTGQHATTYLCLKNLFTEDLKNKKIIDIGAGSGILGTAALMLGAESADLVENDEQAIESCEETLSINQVASKGKVYLKSIFDQDTPFQSKKYDIAFINIIAEVIVQILDITWVQKIPTLFLSGIIMERKDMVIQKAQETGFNIEFEESRDEWVFLKLKK